jgi:hypothetical protein
MSGFVARTDLEAARETQAGILRPFRSHIFAALWVAALVCNIGTWMQNVGAGEGAGLFAPPPSPRVRLNRLSVTSHREK